MRKVILGKKEGVYGTDAAPTTAANAFVTRNFSAEPIVVDKLERNLDIPARGRSRSASTNRRTTFGFEVELSGSGAAGTAAPFMELLEGCGMAAPVLTTAIGAEKAEQRFAAEDAVLSSLSFHHWIAQERARALGARGTFSMDFTAGAYAFARLDLTALLPPSPAVDATAPVGNPDFTRFQQPLEVNTANTDFTLDGYALALRSFSFDVNADIKLRNLVGANYVQRGNHAITGRIVGEAPNLGTKNFYTTLDSGAEVPFALTHGIVAGNIVQLGSSYLEVIKISRTEEDDKLMLDISFGLNIRAGQDDLLITAR